MIGKSKHLAILLAFCLCCFFTFGNDAFAEDPDESDPELSVLPVDYLDLEGWQEYETVDTVSIWYGAIPLSGDVIAFYEDWHEQCSICFLILGEEKALLWDTGLGIGDLRAEVEAFTDLPVIVLNSHDHFDHIGGNAQFDEVWCYDLPSAIQHLTHGPTETEMEEIEDPSKSMGVLMEKFGIELPDHIPGKAPTGTVQDGQVIDLGGRKLEVIHTPGHQPSCIMLLDRENKLLFTGDMFYPGPLYCMFEDSSFPDYVTSIRKASDIVKEVGIEEVYTSHNLPTADAETLVRFADFLEGIAGGEIGAESEDSEFFEEGIDLYFMDDTILFMKTAEGAEPVSGFSVSE